MRSHGFTAIFKKACRYLKYKLHDQWYFVYFALPVGKELVLPRMNSLQIWRATTHDLSRIQQDLFPSMKQEDGDKEYFRLLGTKGAECFLAEKDGFLVNFTWLFTDLTHSPIMHTPGAKKLLRKGDAFIGPLFTRPDARGAWIFPSVLAYLLDELKKRTDIYRALVFVYDKNPGAVKFYERLGFERV